MDTGDGGKKTAKKLKLFKEESGPPSKRWLRSDTKVGVSTGMNSVGGGEKKSKIDQDEKSADGGAKKRKLSTTENESSPKRLFRSGKKHSDEIEQSGISKSVETESEVKQGKGKKRKLSCMEEETPSKRRLTNKKRLNENLELPIFKLPMELMAKIIDMIPISQWASMESVSRRFQEVMHGMWGQLREIRLDELVFTKEMRPNQVMREAMSKFLIRAPNVVSISGFGEFFDKRDPIRLPLIQLLAEFEHLQTIDFSGGTVITAINFASFLKSSASRESWKRLDVVSGIFGEMSNNVVGINGNQPALNLDYFKFGMDSLGVFGRFLPQIQWSGLKELAIVASCDTAQELLSIIHQCTQVAHLKIKVPKCGLVPKFLQAIVDLEHLSVLEIDGLWSGDRDFRDALPMMIQGLAGRGIIKLALVPFQCTDQILKAIIDHLTQLKSLELDVGNCTAASLIHLTNQMGQLETLKFRLPTFISRSFGSSVIQAICDNMSELQCLHLEDPKYVASLENLQKLKELRVTGRFIDSGVIRNWAHLGFGEAMDSLEFGIQAGIPPETMLKFFKNMPRLRCLRLDGTIERKGILEAIAKSCPKLEELYLGYSPTITSKAIQSIICRCSRLKILKLRGHPEWFPKSLRVNKYRKIIFKL